MPVDNREDYPRSLRMMAEETGWEFQEKQKQIYRNNDLA